MKFTSMQIVRHKKSKKLYCVVGEISDLQWDAVLYRCHDDGLMMNRDGTRIKIISLELVPNVTGRYV